MPSNRLLLVEDDDAISQPLRRGLLREGYEVDLAVDGTSGLAAAMDPLVSIVILDVGLPFMSGLDVCRRARSLRPKLQIILLTALAEEVHAVDGLDAGADDYIAKPFRLAELLARVRAAARRFEPATFTSGGMRLDLPGRRAFLDNNELTLSAKEFDLLAALIAEAGVVVTREALSRDVWQTSWQGSSRTLDQHIWWLRAKIGSHRITTIRGIGFRYETALP